jgi:hypothetical protein
MAEFVVVSAANDRYYPLLKGLMDSVEKRLGKVPLTVLDLGLAADQVVEIRDKGGDTVVPDWDVDLEGKKIRERNGKTVLCPSYFRAFTAQPYLPKYVNGHDIILWIDADAWVQDASCVELYVRSARDGRMSISLEVDRCYGPGYWRLKSHLVEMSHAFGLRKGYKLAKTHTANVGVLALRRDAPHWRLWQEHMQYACARKPHERSQQWALNYVVWFDRLPTDFLPAYCDWISFEATPMLDELSGLLVEPQPPYHPIGIMHNAAQDKNKVYEVKTLQGNTLHRTMRYEDWNR